jgi:hypothetical protein
MKSVISTIAAALVLSAGFATSASAASFSEAPEFRSGGTSTVSRSAVAASAIGAMSANEATIIPVAKSTLSRDEVCKDVPTQARFNELTASNLN